MVIQVLFIIGMSAFADTVFRSNMLIRVSSRGLLTVGAQIFDRRVGFRVSPFCQVWLYGLKLVSVSCDPSELAFVRCKWSELAALGFSAWYHSALLFGSGYATCFSS